MSASTVEAAEANYRGGGGGRHHGGGGRNNGGGGVAADGEVVVLVWSLKIMTNLVLPKAKKNSTKTKKVLQINTVLLYFFVFF